MSFPVEDFHGAEIVQGAARWMVCLIAFSRGEGPGLARVQLRKRLLVSPWLLPVHRLLAVMSTSTSQS
ncbi:unnamed protein product [Boreogadus saida]